MHFPILFVSICSDIKVYIFVIFAMMDKDMGVCDIARFFAMMLLQSFSNLQYSSSGALTSLKFLYFNYFFRLNCHMCRPFGF